MVKYRSEIEPLNPYVPGRPIESVQKEYGLTDVVKIASNENPRGCSPKVKEAIIAKLDDIFMYPDGGCDMVREALSKKLNVSPDELYFGTGADEIITSVCKTYVAKDEEVIIGEISFPQYITGTVTMGGDLVRVPMKDYGFDLDAVKARITPKTKAICLVNPNNPTGTIFSHDEFVAFIKDVPKDVLVVLDEAYGEFADPAIMPRSLELMRQYDNLMIMKTFSKAYGLAGIRVGYAIANKELIKPLEKVRNPFNVSVPAQVAAVAALGDQEFMQNGVAENNKTRDYVIAELRKLGVECVDSQTNFILINVIKPCKEVFPELMKRGYIVRPVAGPGMETFIRASVGTQAQMEGFVKTLADVLGK